VIIINNYVLELDDGTKVLKFKNGNPVKLRSIPMNQYLRARESEYSDQFEKILEIL